MFVICTLKVLKKTLQTLKHLEGEIPLPFTLAIAISSIAAGCWGIWKINTETYKLYNSFNVCWRYWRRNESENLTLNTKVNDVINLDKDIVTEKAVIFQQSFEPLNEDKMLLTKNLKELPVEPVITSFYGLSTAL